MQAFILLLREPAARTVVLLVSFMQQRPHDDTLRRSLSRSLHDAKIFYKTILFVFLLVYLSYESSKS